MAYPKAIDILEKDYPDMYRLIRRYIFVIQKGLVETGGEVHHILPKSLYPSFIREKSNLVRLSPKAHFICHLLLWKITNTREMLFAFSCMKNTTGVLRTSRLYQESKQEFYSKISKLSSERMKSNNPMHREEVREKLSKRNKGQFISDEQRLKASASLKKRWKEQGHPRSGAVISQETRDKISVSNTGKNLGELNPFYGKSHTEGSKKVMSSKKLGLMPWEMNRFNEENIPFYLKSDILYSTWMSGSKGVGLCRKVFGNDRYINSIQPIIARFKGGWNPSECPKWLEWRSHHGL